MTTLRAELDEAVRLLAAYRKHERNDDGCSDHPDAPHGFNRNSSHSEDRYVCDCEGWRPDPSDNPSIAQQVTRWLDTHHAALLAAVEDGERYRAIFTLTNERGNLLFDLVQYVNESGLEQIMLGVPQANRAIDAAIDRARGE